MGCSSSTNTAVQPLRPEDVNGDEDETGSKFDGRGDSAVSKGTTDSGVMMESTEIPVLPGAVPRKLPPLTCVGESEMDRVTQDGARPRSSEILEELLNQGIIPVGKTRERSSGAGEAYSIMLGDGEGVRRRPPARLESLKANKMKNLPSREEIEEKIKLAEERRKLREDELKTRLRTKSARVRGPAPISSTEEDEVLTPVEPLQQPLTPDPANSPIHCKNTGEEAEDGQRVREAGGEGRECREEMGREERSKVKEEEEESGVNREYLAEKINEESDGEEEEGEEEELTQVEEFKKHQLLAALEELENDSSFQHAEDKEEMF